VSYDLAGNAVTATDAEGLQTVFFFDLLNRPVGQRDPRGSSTALEYDPAGNVAQAVDGNGQKTLYAYLCVMPAQRFQKLYAPSVGIPLHADFLVHSALLALAA
jgi:YD repeat-containing protein